jgi:serine/threonine protein kinase/Flp pilus assembly protein TadD
MIGQTVSHYRILEKLGSGGMGIVYKAEDTKLQRTVALKFLHPELTRVEEAKKRFIHEAQAASALDHHNLCTIHEIDETDDHQIFISMAYYEGQSLKERIESNSLSRKEIIDITVQIAQGLSRAHQSGMIHRDVKPANIMITDDGIIKIVDFGLAKLRGHSTLTKAGATPGTIAYMSPERLEGKEVDVRTDIWSYGVLLFEMITGELPFKGEYDQAVIYSIVTSSLDIAAVEQANPPQVLIKVIKKCLEKNPSQRYQSLAEIVRVFARELTDYSEFARQPLPMISTDSLMRLFNRYKILVILTSVLLITIFFVKIYFFPGIPSGKGESIIIADFENFTNEKVFDNSLTNGLQISLKQSEFLNILPTYKINQSLHRMQLPGNQKLDKNTVLAIAERENIPIAITGSIDRLGALYILTGNIIEVASGDIIRQHQISVQKIEDILIGIDKLVRLLRNDLGESNRLINKTSRPLPEVTTFSLEALELYSQGIEFARFGKYEEAIEVEEKAVALDSNFVMAIHRLSYNYKKVGNHKKAIYYHNKILPLIDRVTEKERISILATYYGPDFEMDNTRSYYYAKQKVEKYPDDGVALANMGHWAMLTGDYKTALEYSHKAIEADTIFKSTCYNNIGFTYALMGEPEEALKYFRESKEIRPDYLDIDFYIAQSFWIMGELDSTENIFISLIPKVDNAYRIRIHSYLACVYFYRGMIEQAELHAQLGIDLCQQENQPGNEAYFYYLLSEIYREWSQEEKEQFYTAKAIHFSELPYMEVGLSAIALAQKGNVDKAVKLLERLQKIDEPDPIFQKRRLDMANYLHALVAEHEGDLQKALLHLQQIKKHGSTDPFYWLTRKEIGTVKLIMGDSTALQDYREILAHRGEIILGSLGGIRRSGFWSSHLIPELLAEMGVHYLQRGDSLRALPYLRETQQLWQRGDDNYSRAQEILRILSEL